MRAILIHKCLAGVGMGLLAHQVRPWLARVIPQVRGLFPISCYVLGGGVVIAVSLLLHGSRQAGRVARAFILAGSGVVLGWLLDGWRRV